MTPNALAETKFHKQYKAISSLGQIPDREFRRWLTLAKQQKPVEFVATYEYCCLMY